MLSTGVALIEIIPNIAWVRKTDHWFLLRSCAFLAALATAGCSVSVPLAGFVDMEPLGSVKTPAPVADAALEPSPDSLDMAGLKAMTQKSAPSQIKGEHLSAYVAAEDMPAAHAALHAALEASDGMRNVAWSSAKTGVQGSFASLESKAAAGCRNFISVVYMKNNINSKTMQGTACHSTKGLWTIKNLAPMVKTG